MNNNEATDMGEGTNPEEEGEQTDASEPSDYYVFTSFKTSGAARLTRKPWAALPRRHRTWFSGQRIPVPITEPLEYEIEPDDQGPMMPFFDGVIPLMSGDLLRALRTAGVDLAREQDLVLLARVPIGMEGERGRLPTQGHSGVLAHGGLSCGCLASGPRARPASC